MIAPALPTRPTWATRGAIFVSGNHHCFGLWSPIPLTKEGSGVKASFRLKQADQLSFVFSIMEEADQGYPLKEPADAEDSFRETLEYWQLWMAYCRYGGRWDEIVRRSALTLKLLIYHPMGAIVAAPIMGLPEGIVGSRNWDYRYTWIRGAAFTLYGLMRIGYTEEAHHFMDWLSCRAAEVDVGAPVPLQLMYGIDGRHNLDEMELDHLKGYRESRPVRLGNAAYNQLQLDIYGELMDSIYLFNKYGTPVSFDLWKHCRRLTDWVADHWDQPDEGIWETRGGRKDFVFSRLLCWVALDRASRMCLKHSRPGNRIKWMEERDKIFDQIMSRGWNEERQAFRQHYESGALDAANLLMPLVKFISPTDPRMLSTIDATLKFLTTDSLVYRYDPEASPDGFSGR